MESNLDLKNQRVELEWIDEKGNIIEKSQINFIYIIDVLLKIKDFKRKYVWLSTIDYYGNTFFNVQQVPIVIKELNDLRKEKINLDVKTTISESASFLNKVNMKVHTYIKFVGD